MSKLYVNEVHSKTGSTKALEIDSSGIITTPALPAFRAYSSAGGAWQSFGNTNANVMPFDTTNFNIGNHYNTSSYKFIAPVAGVYSFYFQWYGDGTSLNDSFIQVNSTDVGFSRIKVQGATSSISLLYELSVNDEVQALGDVNNTDSQDWYAGSTYSYFQGHLIG